MVKKSTLISIDILRAIAALGVFFYHQHVGLYLAKYTSISILRSSDNFGATYAVPLFFLISGYCIHLSNLKYIAKGKHLPLKEYYKRRFLRIYPSYLVALIFAIAVNYFTYGGTQTVTDILIHIFVLQGFTISYFNTINLVLWTISIEIAFYAIYPLFYFIRFKYSLNKALLFSLIISSISIIFLSIKGSPSLPQRFCVTNLWFAWCCGAYIADINYFDSKAIKKTVFVIAYVLIMVVFISIHFIPNNLIILSDQFNILIWTAPIVLFVGAENWLRKHDNFIIKAITNVGLSSYSLYLLHQPLIELKNYIAHIYLPARFQFGGVIAGIIIIPVICWYNFILIEKPFTIKKPNTF